MQNMKEKLKTFFWLNAGTLILVVGVYFFKIPNNFSTGGVTGIAVILGKLIPNPLMTPATLIFIMNMALLLLGFIFVNREFGIKTVYCTVLMSVATSALEFILPLNGPLTDQPLLELIFAVFLPGIGTAILFNIQASAGGTDILAMIIRKYTGIESGRALMCADCLVVVVSALIFDVRTALFSLLGLMTKSLVIDSVIENINRSKYFLIATDKPDEFCDFIHNELHRSATIWDCIGTYSHQKKHAMLIAMNRAESVRMRNFARKTDPNAFIVITNTSDIIGKGFHTVG